MGRPVCVGGHAILILMVFRLVLIIAAITAIVFGTVTTVRAATLAEQMSGRILIQAERNGEGWYVYPKMNQRYFLGRPTNAFSVMKQLGLGVTDANLAKIPVAGSNDAGDAALRKKLSGYILIQTEQNGEAWYVYPVNTQRYFLGRPTEAFAVMKQLGLGISNANLAAIPAASGQPPLLPVVATSSKVSVVSSRGTFSVNQMTLSADSLAYKIMTDTGNASDCDNNCTVFSLAEYVGRRNASAGIHGSYFCPSTYSTCVGQTNSYFYPVFNSFSRVMINQDRVKYTNQPMVVFDTTNTPHYIAHTKDFDTVGEFEQRNNLTVQAAISNSPMMVVNGQNVLNTNELDTKQATVKSSRGALGWKGTTTYLFVVSGATVIDSAAVADAMGLDFALNLDGGGSTALYNAGAYIIGPGRGLPNAIVVVPK